MYRTTSFSATSYYLANKFFDKKKTINFEQFLEIFGIF